MFSGIHLKTEKLTTHIKILTIPNCYIFFLREKPGFNSDASTKASQEFLKNREKRPWGTMIIRIFHVLALILYRRFVVVIVVAGCLFVFSSIELKTYRIPVVCLLK